MHRALLLLLGTLVSGSIACAAGVCDAALIKSTYNSFSSDHLDWRLATFVTEHDYDEIKHDEGANAVIYGIPVGETYSDFQKRVHDKTSSYNESLTHDQARNIMWTGLDANSEGAYYQCLQTQVFLSRGLHMAVKSATKTDVSLLVVWNPQGPDKATIAPRWVWRSSAPSPFPSQLQQGQTIVIVPRPKVQQTLAVNYPGFADAVVLEPLSKLPILPALKELVNVTETYYSDNAASGDCGNYGQWASVCSESKPDGWTIVSQSFALTGDRAGCAYAKCELVSPATPTKVCWHFQTQGHSEECGHSGNTGIHYSKGVLTVVWAHR